MTVNHNVSFRQQPLLGTVFSEHKIRTNWENQSIVRSTRSTTQLIKIYLILRKNQRECLIHVLNKIYITKKLMI